MSRKDAFAAMPSKSHPATLKLTWDNANDTFKVYNKQTKQTTLAPLPMKFIMIDNFKGVTGWNEKSGSSYYSNEIRNINTEVLTVKDGTGVVKTGKYNDIKDELKAMGAKYCESLYVMFEDGTIGNILLAGSNVAQWMDFRKEIGKNITTQWIGFANPQKHKKGSITWSTPEIKALDVIDENDANRADNAYEDIEDYKNGVTSTESTLDATDIKNLLDNSRQNLSNEIDDLPF